METIPFNIEILCNIFQYLNLQEQLKSTQVCTQFRDVIVDYIWKKKYTAILIAQTCSNFVLSNGKDCYGNLKAEIVNFLHENKEILNKTNFNEFMSLIGDNIKTLALLSNPSKGQNLYNPLDFGFTFDNGNKFTNLTTIKFKRMIITEEDLKLLNTNCLKLQKLCLQGCLNITKETLVIGDDIQMNTLQSMKMLKSFEIVQNSNNYNHANELLTNFNMKNLKISVRTFKIHTPYNKDEILSRPCEELRVGAFYKQPDFDEFNNSILPKFNNLQKLCLISTHIRKNTINESFFIALRENCKKLNYLKLINFRINNFIPIYNLNELFLERVHDGLTWTNFKQILCDMKLNSFTSSSTSFNGTFEYFDISTTLEYLKIDQINANMKKLFEMNGENLKNLSTLIYDNKELWINLTNCPKLQTLQMVSYGKFQQFLEIFNHSSIINLKIVPNNMLHFSRNDLKTNLLFITIDYFNFQYFEEFWFNLLSNNLKLKLMIRCSIGEINSITISITRHPRFPIHLKSIKVCGCTMGE